MTYQAESFYRATIRQSISETTSVPFPLKVSQIPKLTAGLVTVSPNSSNEEIVEYNGVDPIAKTITIVKRGINPSSQALTNNGVDFNNTTYQKSHSQNKPIRGDVTHLHIIQDYGDLQAQINAKVATSGGLRTGFGTNKHVRVNRTTGAEEVKNVTTVTTLDNTDILRLEQAGGDYEDITWGNVKNAIASDIAPTFSGILGENLIATDIAFQERMQIPAYIIGEAQTTPSGGGLILVRHAPLLLGESAGNTRRSMRIIGNGVSSNSIRLALRKIGNPADNLVVRIETDNAGNPSGTLVNANATGSVSGSSLSSLQNGLTDTTINFGGSFTTTDGVVYHVVVSRSSGVDPTNHYVVGYMNGVSCRSFLNNNFNGTAWQTASATPVGGSANSVMACSFTGAYNRVMVKSSASIAHTAYFDGVAVQAGNIGTVGKFYLPGSNAGGFTGLQKNTTYFLSNTPGAVSTTAGTTPMIVGVSDTTGTNIILSDADDAVPYTSMQTIISGNIATGNITWIADKRCVITHSITGGNTGGGGYDIGTLNGVNIRNTTFTMQKGDVLQMLWLYNSIAPSVAISKWLKSDELRPY